VLFVQSETDHHFDSVEPCDEATNREAVRIVLGDLPIGADMPLGGSFFVLPHYQSPRTKTGQV
jgi:hypothetical protein